MTFSDPVLIICHDGPVISVTSHNNQLARIHSISIPIEQIWPTRLRKWYELKKRFTMFNTLHLAAGSLKACRTVRMNMSD